MLVYHSAERERARKEAGLDGFKFEEKWNVKDSLHIYLSEHNRNAPG